MWGARRYLGFRGAEERRYWNHGGCAARVGGVGRKARPPGLSGLRAGFFVHGQPGGALPLHRGVPDAGRNAVADVAVGRELPVPALPAGGAGSAARGRGELRGNGVKGNGEKGNGGWDDARNERERAGLEEGEREGDRRGGFRVAGAAGCGQFRDAGFFSEVELRSGAAKS